jgi:hypothetical protein
VTAYAEHPTDTTEATADTVASVTHRSAPKGYQMARPYAEGALIYFQRGWSDVFPVGSPRNPIAKSPVPKGVTGYDAAPVGWERIKSATERSLGGYNLGLRMPRQVIGLDVDEYAGHSGAETLRNAEAALGPLPPTYRNTARGRGDAGHRYYRTGLGRVAVPGAEELLAKAYGPNIEILHYGRRYAVAWPSLNPDAGMAPYRWYAPGGSLLTGSPPRVIDLPVLPPGWQEVFTAPIDSPAAQRGSGGNLRAERTQEADDDLFEPAGVPIRRMIAEARTVEQLDAVLTMTAGSVNKTLGGAAIWFARMANAGLFTMDQAAEILLAAVKANGVHSDGWNAANRRKWTAASRVCDGLSQGLNREPYVIIGDHQAVDVHAQLMRKVTRR